MTRRLSLLISWSCSALLLLMPAAAVFFLARLDLFAELARRGLALPIQWETVTQGQWIALWGLTVLYGAIGVVGLFFLRRAFANFARGELFTAANSHDLRAFARLLFVHALAKPLHFAAASVLLSFNHPPGQKMLSLAFGSNELLVIGVGLVLWVMSNLLVEGSRLQRENRQFV